MLYSFHIPHSALSWFAGPSTTGSQCWLWQNLHRATGQEQGKPKLARISSILKSGTLPNTHSPTSGSRMVWESKLSTSPSPACPEVFYCPPYPAVFQRKVPWWGCLYSVCSTKCHRCASQKVSTTVLGCLFCLTLGGIYYGSLDLLSRDSN